MANIKTSLQLFDGMSPALKNIKASLNSVLDSFQAVETASSNAVNISAIEAARGKLDKIGATINSLEEDIKRADEAQQQLNDDMRNGGAAADGLGGKIKSFIAAYVGFAGAKKALSWVQENLDLSNVQTNAERQLKVVLANVGATEEAFQSLKDKATSIQGYSIYGDEAMLGGAGEIATYIKDAKAIESMMGTLANYAAGMTGGAEVNTQQMVDLATQLGKALDGTYDGLKKKGFELSDSQKQIIENGTDMEKALVIDDVISQSWAGLAEQMANTPQGQIIRMKNNFGDLREELGTRAYPAVIQFFDTIKNNMPQIETVMYGLANACNVIIWVLRGVFDGASSVFQFFVDNWGIIAPIIWGIIASLIVYNAAMGIGWLTTLSSARALVWKTACDWAETAAIIAMKAAQYGLNAALALCPLTWIIIMIIAMIAIIYAAVGAINHFAGTSISATGIICGAFAGLTAGIYNTFVVPTQNVFAAFVNYLANVFNNPVEAVKVLFYELADTAIGYVTSMAKAIEAIINKIPGVHVDITSGLDNFQNKIRQAAQDAKDKAGFVDIVKKAEYMDITSAASAGYAFGQGIDDKVKNMLKFEMPQLPELPPMPELDGVYRNTGDTAENTAAMRDSMEMTKSDLKYLRDIAEREVINKYTTAEIKVDMTNNNTINSDRDLDGIVDHLFLSVEEQMSMAAEGVH